jgi:hypothetical protein
MQHALTITHPRLFDAPIKLVQQATALVRQVLILALLLKIGVLAEAVNRVLAPVPVPLDTHQLHAVMVTASLLVNHVLLFQLAEVPLPVGMAYAARLQLIVPRRSYVLLVRFPVPMR